MMPAGLFVESCNYIRLVSLVMGLILFLTAILVITRPLSRQKLYTDEEKRTRAISMYIKTQQDQKGHLFWMLIICAIIVWYISSLIPSSYITNITIQKEGNCTAASPESSYYGEYNTSILYPPILFGLGLVFGFFSGVSRGPKSNLFYVLSYILFFLGTASLLLLFRNTEICSISAKCL